MASLALRHWMCTYDKLCVPGPTVMRTTPRVLAALLGCAMLMPLAALDVGPATYQSCLRGLDALAAQTSKEQRQRPSRGLLSELRALPQPYAHLATAVLVTHSGKRDEALMKLRVIDSATLGGEAKLALADIFLRCGEIRQAVALFTAVDEASSDHDRCLAAIGLSEATELAGGFVTARHWLERAWSVYRAEQRSDDSNALADQLKRRQKHLNNLLELYDHGPGFVAYRRARQAESAGEWHRAAGHYQKVIDLAATNAEQHRDNVLSLVEREPARAMELLLRLPIESVYVSASRCYRARCLIRLGDIREAQAAMQVFIADDPDGAYRGEAWLILADLAFGEAGEFARSRDAYGQVIEWVQRARGRKAPADATVPDRSRHRTAPPPAMRHTDAWGNHLWSQAAPAAVVNQATAAWYLDRLAHDAHMRRALSTFALGRPAEGLADLEAMHALDPVDQHLRQGTGFSNFQRLRDGFLDGRLYATRAELALFRGKILGQVLLAEVFFETERWDEAILAYTSLQQRHHSSLSTDARAYLIFALAAARIYANEGRMVKEELLADFGKPKAPYANSRSSWRAMLALANLHQGQGPIEWLERALEVAPDEDSKVECLVRIGQYCFLLNTEEEDRRALHVFQGLEAQLSEKDHRRRSAMQYATAIRKRRDW